MAGLEAIQGILGELNKAEGAVASKLEGFDLKGLNFTDGSNKTANIPVSGGTPKLGAGNAPSFSDFMNDLVDKVDQKDKVYQKHVNDVLTGRSNNIHGVMMAKEDAKLYFNTMVKMTETIREAYENVMRMQA